MPTEKSIRYRFVRAETPGDSYKKFGISTVTMNDKVINIYGQSFFIILPDRIKENFAIQTDIEELKKSFSPKKYSLAVDDSPLFKADKPVDPQLLLSLTVNTDSMEEVEPVNHFSGTGNKHHSRHRIYTNLKQT